MATIPLNKKNLSYYKIPNKSSYEVINSIATQLRFYIAETLYTHDIDDNDYENSVINLVKKKVIPSNVEGIAAQGENIKANVGELDPNVTIINYFSQASFPFTVYNLGDISEINEESLNTAAAKGRVFIDEFNTYCAVIPIIQTFEMTSFFSTFNDYDEATVRFLKDISAYSQGTYPLDINGGIYIFDFEITFELAKGEYTSDFEAYLEQNKIYDLVHNAELKYNLFIPLSDVTINPITDMKIYLTRNDIDSYIINQQTLASVNNAFTFTTNFDNINLHTKTDPLIFTFNSPIVESSFVDNYTITPDSGGRITLTPDCLVFTYYPFGGQFEANTTYTIIIPKMKLRNESGYYYKSDINLTFTTGA